MKAIKRFFVYLWDLIVSYQDRIIMFGILGAVIGGALIYGNLSKKEEKAPVVIEYKDKKDPSTVLTVNKKDLKAGGKYDYPINIFSKKPNGFSVDSALVTLTLSPVDSVSVGDNKVDIITRQSCISLVGFSAKPDKKIVSPSGDALLLVFGKGKKSYTLGFVTKEGYVTKLTKNNGKETLEVVQAKK